MQYNNYIASITRHDTHSIGEYIDEYTLHPGQGILFYKHRMPEFGDQHIIFNKAVKAFNHRIGDILVVFYTDHGLLISPSLNHLHADVAYINDHNKQEKLTAQLVHKNNSIKYTGKLLKQK